MSTMLIRLELLIIKEMPTIERSPTNLEETRSHHIHFLIWAAVIFVDSELIRKTFLY